MMMYEVPTASGRTPVPTFQCNTMHRELPMAACIDWFVDHNALARRDSPCFRCKQGLKMREAFARS